jgi:peptidoglycan/xylan/chitin deacetylase (PgdA/CDA1 family)
MVTRREFLATGAAAAAAIGVAACSDGSSKPTAASSSAAAATAPSAAPTTPTTTAPANGPALFVPTGPTGRNEVALTFHTAGDPARFRKLVELLGQRNTVITAFMVGQWLDANPGLGKQLHDAGHELANHTYTHPTFAKLSESAMADEIARCRAAIAKVTGDGGRFFRPSGTDDGVTTPSTAVLTTARDGTYATVLGYDVDSLDFKDPGADAVANRTIELLHDGAIISLHFDHQGTIDALPRILDAMAARKLTAVTASTLVS